MPNLWMLQHGHCTSQSLRCYQSWGCWGWVLVCVVWCCLRCERREASRCELFYSQTFRNRCYLWDPCQQGPQQPCGTWAAWIWTKILRMGPGVIENVSQRTIGLKHPKAGNPAVYKDLHWSNDVTWTTLRFVVPSLQVVQVLLSVWFRGSEWSSPTFSDHVEVQCPLLML